MFVQAVGHSTFIKHCVANKVFCICKYISTVIKSCSPAHTTCDYLEFIPLEKVALDIYSFASLVLIIVYIKKREESNMAFSFQVHS